MQAINHLGLPHRPTHEAELIRALIMGIERLSRGSNIAHLIAAPIERIHRSLDRIENSGPERERRRPNRAEYLSPEVIALARQPVRAGNGQVIGKDNPKTTSVLPPQKISNWRDGPSAPLLPADPDQRVTIGALALVR